MSKSAWRLIIGLIGLALSASLAAAQENFPTPGGSRVPGHVSMCLDAQGNAVATNQAGACPGGGGGGGAITVVDGGDVAQGTTTDAACATDNGTCTELALLKRVNQRLTAIQSNAFASSVSITRTNDTNAYTANDVVGVATGSTAAVTFSSIGPSGGGEVLITSVALEIDAAAIISGETSYNLYLYNVTPPSALGDNAAFDIPSGDRASRVAKIALNTPVDEGSTLLIETDIVNKQVTVPAGGSLFGYLVTVGGYTPTASRVYKITLHAIGL